MFGLGRIEAVLDCICTTLFISIMQYCLSELIKYKLPKLCLVACPSVLVTFMGSNIWHLVVVYSESGYPQVCADFTFNF